MRVKVQVQKLDGIDEYTFDTDNGDVADLVLEDEVISVEGADGIVRQQSSGRFLLSLKASGQKQAATIVTPAPVMAAPRVQPVHHVTTTHIIED